MNILRFCILVLSIFLSGCSYVRTYPICLYDTGIGSSEQARQDWPKLQSQLIKTLELVTGDIKKIVIVNSREAVVKTTNSENKALLDVWPPIACYGQSSGTSSGDMLKICQEYVMRVIESNVDGENLSNSVIVPPCQTLPGG